MRTALVTGGNRGIGLEVCVQLAKAGCRVKLGARNAAQGQATAAKLAKGGLPVDFQPLDVTDEAAIAATARAAQAWGGLDILVNNAGISLRGFDAEVVRKTLAVNFYGALRLTDALLPTLRDGGCIVNVSSALGELSCLSRDLQQACTDPALTRQGLLELLEEFEHDVAAGTHRRRGWPSSAYSVSKVALNALTRVLHRELQDEPHAGPPDRGIRVAAVCPGWVRTRMGGRAAPSSVAQGADSIVWVALAGPDGPDGGFYRDRRQVAW